jgi:hypothetical protein
MTKVWKEQTDLKKVTDRVYPTSGKDEVKEQINKAKHGKTPSTVEVVGKLIPKKYPSVKN